MWLVHPALFLPFIMLSFVHYRTGKRNISGCNIGAKVFPEILGLERRLPSSIPVCSFFAD